VDMEGIGLVNMARIKDLGIVDMAGIEGNVCCIQLG